MEGTLIPSLNGMLSRNPAMKALLIGAGSERYRSRLLAKYPDLRPRVFSSGTCDSDRISEFISACDCLFQPYPDGLTTRRTTAMAALANGKPLISIASRQTDAIWKTSPAVWLINASEPTEIAEEAARYLARPELLREGGVQAKRFYEDNFSVSQCLKTLNADSKSEAPCPLTAAKQTTSEE
jgi:glycosyltransferase involved in cell wall biosynthesis